MRQQDRLEQQDDGAEEGQDRRFEQHGSSSRPGRVRGGTRDRGQLHRRQREGEGAGSGQQEFGIRILAHLSHDGSGPVNHERRRGHEPGGSLQGR